MDPEATGSWGVYSINRMALSPMKTMTHLPISAWIFFSVHHGNPCNSVST